MLHLVGIQHGDGVAVSNADNPARDRLGMGSAGQRQRQQQARAFPMVGLRLAADNNIQPWQRPHDLHGFKAHSDNPPVW